MLREIRDWIYIPKNTPTQTYYPPPVITIYKQTNKPSSKKDHLISFRNWVVKWVERVY